MSQGESCMVSEDRHARAHRPAGRADVELDAPVRRLGGEQENLRAEPVGDVVVDLGAEEDDPLAQQRRS